MNHLGSLFANYMGSEQPHVCADYADINLVDAIKRVSGVGDVKNFTAQDYSMRVYCSQNKIAALGITPEDIANAIREPNAQTPAVWQNYNNVFNTRL
jgi:multidrug efflux pump subunit AcrB